MDNSTTETQCKKSQTKITADDEDFSTNPQKRRKIDNIFLRSDQYLFLRSRFSTIQEKTSRILSKAIEGFIDCALVGDDVLRDVFSKKEILTICQDIKKIEIEDECSIWELVMVGSQRFSDILCIHYPEHKKISMKLRLIDSITLLSLVPLVFVVQDKEAFDRATLLYR